MPQRMSITDKILSVLSAVAKDTTTVLTYGELHRKVYHDVGSRGELSKAIHNLRHTGYLEIVEKDNQRAVVITNKGRIKSWQPIIDKRWDGRWRLVAFDIAEKTRSRRDWFRNALKLMGFKQMQKSLWICPYDVSEEIEKVIDMLNIEDCVDYFIADAITNKSKYMALFNLKQ